MREYSDFEKSVIIFLIELNPKGKITQMCTWLEIVKRFFISVPNKRRIFFREPNKFTYLHFPNDEITISHVIEFILLLNELQNHNLISLQHRLDGVAYPEIFFIASEYDMHYISKRNGRADPSYLTEELPTEISVIFHNLSAKHFVHISHVLIDLAENNFKSKESLRHEEIMAESKKQTKSAIKTVYFSGIAIIIALITMMFSMK